MTYSDYEVVFTCSQEFEAEMIKTNLISYGIDAIILSHKDRNYPAVGDLAIIKILVPATQKDEAKKFISEIQPIDENLDIENESE